MAALKDTFKVENIAPGHCTGEPTFAALKEAFGDRYIYAGIGTSLPLGPSTGVGGRRGERPTLEGGGQQGGGQQKPRQQQQQPGGDQEKPDQQKQGGR